MNIDRTSARARVASRDEWRAARVALLEKEKALTAMKDAVAAERRALPWVRVEKDYVFDGPTGPVTLCDLFDGRSQLFIKHFMMGPGQSQQCVGCSLEVDHLTGIRVHLENHDVTYAVIARAPIEQIERLKHKMGWDFTWVSSYRNDFNFDFNVSFSDAEIALGRGLYNFREVEVHPGMIDLSGDSVFIKNDAGEIFHTYSTYGRGLDTFVGAYHLLDIAPKGRDEDGLKFSMAWVRRHDEYEGATVDPNAGYVEPKKTNFCCN